MSAGHPENATVFLETLRAGVGDGLLPLTPVQTEYGVVMGAARERTLDHLQVYNSVERVVATIALDPDGRIALELHRRHVVLLEEGAVAKAGHPDADCDSFLIDEHETVDRRGGLERSRIVTDDMFSQLWDYREEAQVARLRLGRIWGILDIIDDAEYPDRVWRTDDIFNPANTQARGIAVDMLDDRGYTYWLFRNYPVPEELEPGFTGHRIAHRIMDRAAWVALQGLRSES